MPKSVLYFISGDPKDDLMQQQIIRVKRKDERALRARRSTAFLRNFAEKTVRTINMIFADDEEPQYSTEVKCFYSLMYFDKNGLECQEEAQRAQQAALDIYAKQFSDAWNEVDSDKKPSARNEFDELEFERLYTWEPTEKEKSFIFNAIRSDLNQSKLD